MAHWPKFGQTALWQFALAPRGTQSLASACLCLWIAACLLTAAAAHAAPPPSESTPTVAFDDASGDAPDAPTQAPVPSELIPLPPDELDAPQSVEETGRRRTGESLDPDSPALPSELAPLAAGRPDPLLGTPGEMSSNNSPGRNSTGNTSVTAGSVPAKQPTPRRAKPPAFPGAKTLPPLGPYRPLFYENDFSLLNDPQHDWLLGERLKQIPTDVGGYPVQVSTGGEIRYRYLSEENRLRPGPPGDNDMQQWRWRHYVDMKGDTLRLYGELLHADTFDSELPLQPIDRNVWEIQNLFVDWAFAEGDLGRHTLRVGRQELLYGRQRLVSPLEWGNTRRNFEGVKYLCQGDDARFEAFLTHPVNPATGFGSSSDLANSLDRADRHVWFGGTHYSHTGWKDTVLDLYWFVLDTNHLARFHPDMQRHTVGSHWAHLRPLTDAAGQAIRTWDFDVEAGFQGGTEFQKDVLAGFATAVVGHTWNQAPWSPRFSGLFYYGSGTVDRLGSNNTMYVMFPLGHAYWGLSDNLSGQNLYDFCLQADVKPTRKTALTSAFHWFQLASSQDTAYTVGGLPIGRPGHGTDVGNSLDIYGYYAFNPNFDIQVGQSWFWYGSYIEETTPRGDGQQFYIMTSLRY